MDEAAESALLYYSCMGVANPSCLLSMIWPVDWRRRDPPRAKRCFECLLGYV